MTNANQIAMGENHMCEIRNGGEVWCQGDNGFGQLGDGSTKSGSTMVRAGDISDAVSVYAGYDSTFVITATGDLYAWGSNRYGALGIGTYEEPSKPVLVPGVSGVKKVANDSVYSTIILLDDGTVRVAGYVNHTGSRSGESCAFGAPTSISDSAVFSGVKDIANGVYTTYLINGDGTVWGVGSRTCNALNNFTSIFDDCQATWTRIGNRTDAEKLWGRALGGVYKTTGDEYYGWGYDGYGDLGLGSTSIARHHTALPHYADAKQLTFGGCHAVMLKNDGTVWSNGRNSNGQLGDGSTSHRYSPIQVGGISGDAVEVIAGVRDSLVITTTGRHALGGAVATSGI